MRITERDRAMLAFAAEQRFVLAAQVGRLLAISDDGAGARLRGLRDAGYLASAAPFREEPAHYQVTTPGLRAIASDLPRPRKVDLATYRHDAGLAWLTVAARRGRFGALEQIVSERRMRSHDRRGDERAETFGVRLLGEVGRDGGARLHYPDLLVVTDTGHRVAFELELTTKQPRRRERILAAYGADPRIDAVIYLVDDPARRRAIAESVRRVGIADRVRVERVVLGHAPGHRSPAPARTADRRRPPTEAVR